MTIDAMRELLRRSLKPKRFCHSCAVFDEALKLADRFDADRDKVAVAALLHDCGREVPTPEGPRKAAELGLQPDPVVCAQPILAHPLLGAWYAEHKYGVTDPEILDAIRLHTTGGPDMTQTAKIVFLADMTEPARDFPGVDELRSLCRKDLDKAMLQAYKDTMAYLLGQDLLVHPDAVAGYNQLAAQFKAKKEQAQ